MEDRQRARETDKSGYLKRLPGFKDLPTEWLYNQVPSPHEEGPQTLRMKAAEDAVCVLLQRCLIGQPEPELPCLKGEETRGLLRVVAKPPILP